MLNTKTQSDEKVIHKELSYIVTGILFDAHNELGRFAKEKQYGDFIETKLIETKIPYQRELTIGNSGNTPDFNIDDKIIIELKGKPYLTDKDYSQIKRYLHTCNLDLGILVNFREITLKPRRVLNQMKNL